MEIDMQSKQENKLLNRLELRFKIIHEKEKTPLRTAVRDHIASKFNVGKDRVIVDHMHSVFGKGETWAYVKIYNSKEDAEKYERPHILKRNYAPKKSEKSEEKGAEEKKEEG